MFKISSRYLEKCSSFGVLKVENGHFFTLFPAISAFFQFSKFVRFGPFKNCSRVFFCVLDEKRQKHVSFRPNTIFLFDPYLTS